jgi:hypothetical protein
MRYKNLLVLIVFLLNVNYLQSQVSCSGTGDVFVFANYDGGHLTIDADVNIPGIKIGIRSYERTRVTVIGTYSANIDTIIIRGFNSGNNHCPPAIATNTVVQAHASTVKIYNNGTAGPHYNYTCSSLTAANTLISFFTNGAASRLRGYVSFYECWCNPQKLSIAATYCCKGAYSCFTALPVELIDFRIEKFSINLHKLVWRTQSEKNTEYFELEESLDGITFNAYSKIAAILSENEVNSYEVIKSTGKGFNTYYRLKMVDKDGGFKYSSIISNNTSESDEVILIKTSLITDEIEFLNVSMPTRIELFSIDGKLQRREDVSNTKSVINVQDLPKGIYLLRFSTDQQPLKIIKN